MKKLLTILIIVFIHQMVIGQIIDQKSIEALTQDNINISNAIPGSQHPLLIEKENNLRNYFEQNPDAKISSLSKPAAWGFSVGDSYSWWADYFEEQDNGDEQYLVPSTCRAVGTHCYVFVEDAVWNTLIDQSAVDGIAAEFDNTIYPTDVVAFGTPPDVDSDPRIIILVLDIQDGNDPSGYVAGYFYSANELEDPAWGTVRSNEAEIFYMDCYPADPVNDPIGVFGTTAHEFQHMIHYAHGYPEMTFINEGLSEIASYICGYGLRSNGLYTQNTNRNLLTWESDDALPDYSRAAFWTLYLYEQFGVDILKDFVDGQHGDWVAIDNTIRPHYASGFISLVTDWWIANYANGESDDTKYNYTYSPLSKPTPAATHIGNSGTGSGALQPLSAEYITFSGGDDLTITFSGQSIVKVKALKIGSLEIQTLDIGTEYAFPDYGTTYSEITFLVYNDSPGATQNYSYIAVGAGVNITMEIAYEDGISDGTFAHSTGDSMAVIFTGVSGARLDSIKTYHTGTGKIRVDISKWTGSGAPLRAENMFRSTPPGNIDITNDQAWHKIDLTSENLDATDDFVVSYLVGNDPSNPNIGVRDMDPTGFYHSRTYDGSWNQYYSDRDSNNSYDPTIDGNWNYLIRAYVSIGDATVAIDPTGIVTIPKDFSLGANYPNPFNPSTTFDFAAPNDGIVNFTVYDLLGQVIYSENRNLLAGNYQFTWDGQNQLDQQVVSGVYFLKMEADGFTQTRKMLMMK